MGNKSITVSIEETQDENKLPTGYCVEVKAGIFNKQKFFSDTLEGAVSKSMKHVGKQFGKSLFTNNLIDMLRQER